jgi:hypothetical protein
MQRVAIDVAMNGDRANAHLFAGPDDSARNLSPIGDENFSEASRSVHNIADLQLPIGDWRFIPSTSVAS